MAMILNKLQKKILYFISYKIDMHIKKLLKISKKFIFRIKKIIYS